MGGDPDREPPFFFSKPADAVVPSSLADDSKIQYPLATKNLHYEIELVVAIGTSGVKIAQADALSHVFGYAVGIDLTRRDLQQAAKDRRGPWDNARFDRHQSGLYLLLFHSGNLELFECQYLADCQWRDASRKETFSK
jgi:fumarylpyruvate hydrolase